MNISVARAVSRSLARASVLALVTAIPPGFNAASAADTAESTRLEGVLGEVIVSARYKKEDLQETPIALTAITGDQLTERGYRNILDLGQTVPNVTLQNATAGRGKSAQTFIRGVGQGDFNFAFEPGVGFYIDDVYHATVFGSIFELHDVDRIEVLRGPQGTLFGKNSEGGAVRFYSRKPAGDNTGFFEVGAGSYDGRSVKGAFDIPLIQDELALRVSGGSKRSDGYMDRLDYVCLNPTTSGSLRPQTVNPDCKLGTLGGEDISSFRAALRWTPNEDWEVNLIGDYLDDNGEPAPQQIIARNPTLAGANPAFVRYNEVLVQRFGIPADGRFVSPNRFSTYANFREPILGIELPIRSTVESWGVSGTVDWDTPFGPHVKSITAYREYEGDFSSDQGLGPFALSLNYNTVAHHQFSQELQVSDTAFGERLEWTAGLYYFDGYSRNGGFIDIPYTVRDNHPVLGPGGLGLFFIQNDPATNTNKSAFAHVIVHATDRLSFEAGLRYSEETKDYTFYRWMPNFHVPPLSLPAPVGPANRPQTLYPHSTDQFLFPITTGSAEESRTDPKVGVQFQWTPDIMTYAQYATGYKSGGINPRPTVGDEVLPFGPEELTSYEVGAKTEWFDNRLRFNTDVFYSDYEDLQLVVTTLLPSGRTSAIVRNVGHVVIEGWEGELQAELIDGLMVNASAGYLDYQVKDTGGVAGITKKSKPIFIPEMKWNVGVQYRIPLGSLGSVTPRLDYTHQSKTYNDSANREDNAQEAYGLLTARLGWTDAEEKWSTALTFLNAADEEYYISRAYTSGLYEGQPGRPRTWSFTVRRNFF